MARGAFFFLTTFIMEAIFPFSLSCTYCKVMSVTYEQRYQDRKEDSEFDFHMEFSLFIISVKEVQEFQWAEPTWEDALSQGPY